MSNLQAEHNGSPQSVNMSYHSDHAQGPVRKKMRKGTKSCIECRRRKIKCTFEPGRPQVCNECHTRGSTCIDQEHGDLQVQGQQTADQSAQSLRERVAALEGLVKQVLNKLPEAQTGAATTSSLLPSVPPSVDDKHLNTQVAELLKNPASAQLPAPPPQLPTDDDFLPGGVGDAPTLSLFDNAVIKRTESEPTFTRAQYNKNRALIVTLTQLLPSAHDLNVILESSLQWWSMWTKVFPGITDSRCETIKEAISHSLRSDKPAEIAKIMLCIAISLHQMSDDFDWSRLHLTEPRSRLMDNYLSVVDKLIISDDEMAATVEGIECIILASKYQINMGRPRRAWLLNHRAIAFCQLLGFHRLLSQPNPSNPQFRRSFSIWSYLIMCDRFLALLLGIPYTVSEPFCSSLSTPAMSQYLGTDSGEIYTFRLLSIITKIVDRNQAPVPLAYSVTMRLDQELEELHASQDPAWWSTEGLNDQGGQYNFSRLSAQMFHYQTKLLLHMPFMLRSSSGDKRYHYSHASALDGARHMIRCYQSLRSTSAGPLVCKLTDFQAFTAATLLFLNMFGYSSVNRTTQHHPHDLDQDQRDSELIDTTITLLRDASKELGGVVATQSVQALELMALARQGYDEKEEVSCAGQSFQISIPFFGIISISRGKNFVPIKPGTYPKLGETRKTAPGGASGPPASNGSSVNVSGLPTPPSMASCSSTQHSPMPPKNLEANATNNIPAQSQYDTPGIMSLDSDQSWNSSTDPFITFDAFMALPELNMPLDFPTTDSTGSGLAPVLQQQQPSYGPVTRDNVNSTVDENNTDTSTSTSNRGGKIHRLGGFNIGSETQPGFPFGCLPSSQANNNNSNIDLDEGWNWFGVDAPIIP